MNQKVEEYKSLSTYRLGVQDLITIPTSERAVERSRGLFGNEYDRRRAGALFARRLGASFSFGRDLEDVAFCKPDQSIALVPNSSNQPITFNMRWGGSFAV
jgi:hypothetical protein